MEMPVKFSVILFPEILTVPFVLVRIPVLFPVMMQFATAKSEFVVEIPWLLLFTIRELEIVPVVLVTGRLLVG